MSWRDKLQKGSFRGAPFLWQKAEAEVGRRTARHDYPLRDDAYFEDMGRSPREFTLEVFVIGPEYMDARDTLVSALEEPGYGTLVHPTMGTLSVQLSGKARISESTDEGGMARFTLPFVLAGENKLPSSYIDTASVVETKSDAVLSTISNEFEANAAVNIAKSSFSLAEEFIYTCKTITARITAVKSEVAKVQADLARMKASLNELISAPYELAQTIQGLITSVTLLAEDPLSALDLYKDFFDFGSDKQDKSYTTAIERQEADGQEAVTSLVQVSAIASAASAVAVMDLSAVAVMGRSTVAVMGRSGVAYQEVLSIRDLIIDKIDAVMEMPIKGSVSESGYTRPISAGEYGISDDIYNTLFDLRFAISNDITERGADLARIVPYTPDMTLPAMVIAYKLYGDISKADEIIARNHIPHPGFVQGGQAIEVPAYA